MTQEVAGLAPELKGAKKGQGQAPVLSAGGRYSHGPVVQPRSPACAISARVGSQISVPGGWLACGSISSGLSKLERTKIGMLWTMPSSTERTWSTFAPWEASSSMSSNAILSRRRAFGTIRGSVV